MAGRMTEGKRTQALIKKWCDMTGKNPASLTKLERGAFSLLGKGDLRTKSTETIKEFVSNLSRFCRHLEEITNGKMTNITEIKPKHVGSYLATLEGLSPGRVANHATMLREVARQIGKADIVPANSKIGCVRSTENRTKWADTRYDVVKGAEVRGRLVPQHRIAYDMQRHFGLRQKEALLSYRVVADKYGCEFLVVEGAKGGRPRQVPVTTEEQRSILATNAEWRTRNGGKLIDQGLKLLPGLQRYKSDLHRAGARREDGTNSHACRREFIIERCKEISALPKSEREAALKELVEIIGHGRPEVITAYTSLLE